MRDEVSVPFEINNEERLINVQYQIELDEHIQTIVCNIDIQELKGVRHLMQLRSFELRALLMYEGTYAPVFTDNEYIRNKHISTFLNKAYECIMDKEGLIIEEQ